MSEYIWDIHASLAISHDLNRTSITPVGTK